MNHKLLTFSLLLLLCHFGARAQTISWMGQVPAFPVANLEDAIVRHYAADMSITYVHTPSGTYFGLVDAFGFSSSSGVLPSCKFYQVTSQLRVNDFRVVDHYVFFCGVWNLGESAYGYFDIDEMTDPLTPFVQLHIYHSALFGLELRRMVAYKHNGTYRLVAVGTHENEIDTRDCLFEIRDVTGNGDYVLLSYFIPTEQPYRELLDDILLVRDKVVVVGRDTRIGGNVVSLRVAPLDSVINYINPNSLETEYHFPVMGGGDLQGRLRAGSMDVIDSLGTFALACVYGQPDDNTTHTRLFRIQLNAYVPTITHAQDMVMDNSGPVKEVVSWPGSDRIVFLHGVNAGAQQLVQADMAPLGGYGAPTLETSDRIFSLGTVPADYFVGWVGNNALYQRLPGIMPGLSCLDFYIKPIVSYPTIQIDRVYMPPFYHGGVAEADNKYPSTTLPQIYNGCIK